jgi:hypothetical protein
MEFPDTSLVVTLATRRGTVQAVDVRSGRLVRAASAFGGRTPAEVLGLLPTLFALCGTAQGLTGLAAMETAAGLTIAPATLAARRLLVLAETVSEHGLSLTRDWPILHGTAPDLAAARRFKLSMGSLRDHLYPDGDALTPGGGRLAPDHAGLDRLIDEARAAFAHCLGLPPDGALTDRSRFQAWLTHGTTGTAHLLTGALIAADFTFGAGPFHPMPAGGPADLDSRLAADTNGTYLARPDCAGLVLETGPLTRNRDDPLIADLLAKDGTGLLTRLTSRLVDMAAALREMARLVQDLIEQPASPIPLDHGTGLATTEAARGLLAHRVSLEGGRVSSYQILAPTEWNFHPNGPLARGLVGVRADAGLPQRAALLVNALDPCVHCRIEVE